MKIDISPLPPGSTRADAARASRDCTKSAPGSGHVSVKVAQMPASKGSIGADTKSVEAARSARVNAIKQAIATGHFTVNSETVADRMLFTAWQRLNSHRA